MSGSLSITESAARLRAGEIRCTELVEASVRRAEALQPVLNAFITIAAEQALARARALEQELRAGTDRGPLHGIPIVVKDCLDTAGVRTTIGSRYFRDRVPAANAEVVERLLAAGAVVIGKTNMNECAAGTSGRNAAFGDVRNPWALERSPGGSSSGTAAAVAAGAAAAGVGTDTGGSIRIPAACTGTVGLRPTLGSVPDGGCFRRSFSFDVAGPLARSVGDCALVYAAMAGRPALEPGAGVAGVRLGVIRDFSFRDLDPQVEAAVRAALARLAALGAEVREVSIPRLDAFRYEALYDILLYEFHQSFGEHWRRARRPADVFGPVVLANLERGSAIREETYRAALAARAADTAAVRAIFAEVDALVTPVLPRPTPRLDAPTDAFERQRQFMLPFSFVGLPAIAVPCGLDGDGLPLGMQLVGERLQEHRLLRIAAAYESAGAWHRRFPQLP